MDINNSCSTDLFVILPLDTINEIVSYLSDRELMQIMPLICKAFQEFSNSHLLEAEWKKRTIKRLGICEGERFFFQEKSWKRAYLAFRRLPDCAYAQILHGQGNFKKAALKYQEALKAKPKDNVALLGYAQILCRWNDYIKAQIQVETALEIEPSNAFALKLHGTTLLMLGRYQEAQAQFKKAKKIIILQAN